MFVKTLSENGDGNCLFRSLRRFAFSSVNRTCGLAMPHIDAWWGMMGQQLFHLFFSCWFCQERSILAQSQLGLRSARKADQPSKCTPSKSSSFVSKLTARAERQSRKSASDISLLS